MMIKLFPALVKELLLLRRDRAGLAVLFVMPVVLVVVITLVQKNVMELTGQTKTRLLISDLDGGILGKSLCHTLEAGHFEIIRQNGEQKNLQEIQVAVIGGDYQLGIVIPAGSSVRLQSETADFFLGSKQVSPDKRATGHIPVYIFFDPAVMPAFRSGLTAQLRMALETVALETKIEQLQRELKRLSTSFEIPPDALPFLGDHLSDLFRQPLFSLTNFDDSEGINEVPIVPIYTLYNPVQQNVPAWALFGMFFTAIPIAGGILQERNTGIWLRLTTLPVSHFLLFTAKILAYIGVCFCQFLLISLIGAYLFPFIGLPIFSVAQNIPAILTVVLFSSLAACGYGIFLGSVCRTYEQASTLGATSVVAAAAIGGVMVPVYAMPKAMQQLSIISPLNWGLTALHDLLLRGYSFSAVLDDLTRLGLFFALTVLFSWKLTRK